ncbi:MAG: ribonuclease H [Chlorobiota bacterium]
MMTQEIDIYTDGSCLKNPGKGGWGIVIVEDNKIIAEYSKGYQNTTNSRMEMYAILMALKYASKNKAKIVNIKSDSNFIVQAINKNWLENWVRKGWKKSGNEPVANADIWKPIYKLYTELSGELEINFIKVKAHSGIEFNEEVDELARAAAMQEELSVDKGYQGNESSTTDKSLFKGAKNKISIVNVDFNGVSSLKIKEGKKEIIVPINMIKEHI